MNSVTAGLFLASILLLASCSGAETSSAGREPTPSQEAAAPSPTPKELSLSSLFSPPPGDGWTSDSAGPVVVTDQNRAEVYGITPEQAAAEIEADREAGLVEAATQSWSRPDADVSQAQLTVRRYSDALPNESEQAAAVALDVVPAPPVPMGVVADCRRVAQPETFGVGAARIAAFCDFTSAEHKTSAFLSVAGDDEMAVQAALAAQGASVAERLGR